MNPRLIVAILAAIVVIAGGGAPPSSAALAPSGATHRVQSLQSRVDPGPTPDPSVVPQTISRPGEPGYNVVPASQFRPSLIASSGRPPFRGGRTSTPPAASALQAPPRSPVAPSSPKIGYSVATWGMTAGGFPITPPDSTGAIGPSHYVEMVNSRVAVYDRNLTQVGSTTALTTFIGVPSMQALCDPQIQWVPSANRWLFVLLLCNAGAGSQGFYFGYSKTADPTNLSPAGWCAFGAGTGAKLFDYPKLGHNSNYMIVGGNLYDNPTTANPTLAGSAIVWAPLPATGPILTCPATGPVFGGTPGALRNGDGTYAFTPVPVNTYTNATDGYVLAAFDPGGNAQPPGARSKVAVWHLDSGGTLHADNDVTVNPYNAPTSAAQQGAPAGYTLDTLDGRLTQAVGDPVAGFWTQHTVLDPSGRSEVDWYEFMVSGPSVVLVQQGSIRDPGGDWIFNGAISPRSDGQGAAIMYNHSSLNTHTWIGAQIRYQATPLGAMAAGELMLGQGVNPATDGTCTPAFGGPPCRWGDYAAATPDPVQTNLVWGTNQVNVGSGSSPGWFTQNFAIAPTPEAPINVRASPDRSSATVTWAPGAADPGAPPTSYSVIAYFNGTNGAPMIVAAPTTSVTFPGLAPGVTYTFGVTANSSLGPSLESARSNGVVMGAAQSAPVTAAPPRDPAAQSTGTVFPPQGR